MLTVLDLNGRELTRESRGCANEISPHFGLNDNLCPIIGTAFEIVNAQDGQLEILVGQDFDTTEGTPRDYVLQGGVYKDINVLQSPGGKSKGFKHR
jgi:hypothetical protein